VTSRLSETSIVTSPRPSRTADIEQSADESAPSIRGCVASNLTGRPRAASRTALFNRSRSWLS
jgi:hypothetical protein